MNFLFGALLLIIILLPGVVLRVSYLSVPYAKKTFRFSLVDELILSLIPTLILQGLGYSITNYLIKDVDEKRLYYLFINSDKVFAEPMPDLNVSLFLLYTIILCGISVALGFWLRKFVQRKKIDIKFPILRFYNDWHYILKGLILDFPGHAGDSENVDNVWIDVVTVNRDDTYLYSGFLKEYVLTKEDGLDRIYLTNVRRRRLFEKPEEDENEYDTEEGAITEEEAALVDEHEKEMIDYDVELPDEEMQKQMKEIEKYTNDEYYYMPGDYFVIPYSEIKNINVSYYKERILREGKE